MKSEDLARKLVLTPHKTLKKKSLQGNLFLGKWCFDDYMEDLDDEIKIVPFHWNDRDKMHSDFSYANKIYERILEIISEELNKIHKVKHTQKYWRILIGPWLYAFINALFDKWELVRLAERNYNISSVDIIDFDYECFVVNEFSDIDPDNIDWIHYLLSESIKFQNKLQWSILSNPEVKIQIKRDEPSRKSVFRNFGKLLNNFLCKLTREDEVFFIDTYIPKKSLFLIYLSLFTVPKIWKSPIIPKFSVNKKIRFDWIIEDNNEDQFTKFVLQMIPYQLPRVYLEGYKDLEKIVSNLSWPKKPTAIFSSNSFQFCEPFQMWAAKKVESGSKLIIGQHGGFYGSGKWHCGENHQVKIADKFISWGWTDSRKNIVPWGVLTNIGKPLEKFDKVGTLLFVTNPIRIFGYKAVSWPVGPDQAKSFLDDQLSFINSISKECRKSLIVRINKKQDEKMKSSFLNKINASVQTIKIDDSSNPIEKEIKKCRFFVYSCNSTGYLETLSRGIPTVMFWNPKLFELRDSAKPFFDTLKSVGILHEDPVSAADHISKYWNDVDAWWQDDKVKEAVKLFCDNYAPSINKPSYEFKKFLQIA